MNSDVWLAHFHALKTQPTSMQTNLKYIMLPASVLTHDIETPIMFPTTLQHNAVALAFAQYGTPVSAGFVLARGAAPELVAVGESNSLKLSARSEDSATLNLFFS